MKDLAEAIPWLGFWAFMCILVWTNHTQYIQGHNTLFFGHKTPEKLRIREAVIRKLEREANKEEDTP